MTVELDRLEALEDLAKLSSSDKFHELRIRALEVIPRDAESLREVPKELRSRVYCPTDRRLESCRFQSSGWISKLEFRCKLLGRRIRICPGPG